LTPTMPTKRGGDREVLAPRMVFECIEPVCTGGHAGDLRRGHRAGRPLSVHVGRRLWDRRRDGSARGTIDGTIREAE
jgi:hypothetical protein